VRVFRGLALAGFVIAFVTAPLRGGTIALTVIPSGAGVYAPITVGWRFLVNQNISVDGLGVFDYQNDGFVSGSLQVGLWDDSGQLLASTSVSSSDSLISGFRARAREAIIQSVD
jgi:hypothetical protein